MPASQKIFDFFDEITLEGLLGSKSKLTIEFNPEINGKDGIFFNNKEVDSLEVKTIGEGKYTEIIAQLSGISLK